MYYNSNRDSDYSIHTASSVSVREQAAKSEYNREKLLSESRRLEEAKKEFDKFSIGLREFLVVEALNSVLEASYMEGTSATLKKYGKSLINDFVQEEGCLNLLNKFKSSTEFLSNVASIVESSYSEIIEAVDPTNPDSFRVMDSSSKAFYDKISDLSVEKVSKEINKRVTDATNNFVKSNLEDKAKMEELAENIKEKSDSTKEKNQEDEDNIKQEFANMYRRQINSITNSKNRTILETMINHATKKVLKNESLLESYQNESGKLDVNKIVESTAVSYTFLEMINTLNIKNINESELKELILG